MAGGSRAGGLTALLLVLMAASTLALMITPAVAARDVPLEALDSCVRKLNPDVDIGYERIAARCPELVRHLQERGWEAWLPRDWQRPRNDLSAGGLRELRRLLARELTPHERAQVPSVASLPGVLAGLAQRSSAQSGWWARTKAWLRNVFERGGQAADGGWLTRMSGQNTASQTVIELISYAALALVVLLAAVIVVNELRVGGVLGGLRGRCVVRGALPVRLQGDSPTWDDVQKAVPRQRPGLLLELIVGRLTAESCLPPARGLTVRELTRAAWLPDARDLDRLKELARMSERVRFSSTNVADAAIATAVEGGRMLLERISGRASDYQAGRP
ncbi:MAG: hypothetical protein ACRETD_02745 [Steroidobacteraceae bacterium]